MAMRGVLALLACRHLTVLALTNVKEFHITEVEPYFFQAFQSNIPSLSQGACATLCSKLAGADPPCMGAHFNAELRACAVGTISFRPPTNAPKIPIALTNGS